MSRFEKLLEQQYLKLDLPVNKLTDVQKNVVDKITAFDGATYDGVDKGCAIVSYKHEGKQGKLKIDPSGKISSQNAEEAEENAEEYMGTVSKDDSPPNAESISMKSLTESNRTTFLLF